MTAKEQKSLVGRGHGSGTYKRQAVEVTIARNGESAAVLAGIIKDALDKHGLNVLAVTACHKRFVWDEKKP